jgi:hypothetical protein
MAAVIKPVVTPLDLQRSLGPDKFAALRGPASCTVIMLRPVFQTPALFRGRVVILLCARELKAQRWEVQVYIFCNSLWCWIVIKKATIFFSFIQHASYLLSWCGLRTSLPFSFWWPTAFYKILRRGPYLLRAAVKAFRLNATCYLQALFRDFFPVGMVFETWTGSCRGDMTQREDRTNNEYIVYFIAFL